jgi:hypothetical protein
METLKEIFESGKPFKLSEKDVIKYNAMDHENHKTGIDHKGNKTGTCIYSVYKIDHKFNIAFTQAWNAWGQIIEESHKLNELALYEK